MRFLTFFERSLPEIAFKEHDSIIRNIEESNLNEAIIVLSNHIQKTRDSYVEILSNKISEEEFGTLRFLIISEKLNE